MANAGLQYSQGNKVQASPYVVGAAASVFGLPGSSAIAKIGKAAEAAHIAAKSTEEGANITRTLFQYTNEEGFMGILESGELRASTRALNPNDIRYGNGQYLSDIQPGTRTAGQLSFAFLRLPYQGRKFTHFLEIDVTGLTVKSRRPGVFVVPNEKPLDLAGRIIRSGANQ